MGSPRDTYEPSPEEITRKCNEIQENWSKEEREKRMVGHSTDKRYTVPEVESFYLPEECKRKPSPYDY